MCGRYSLSVSFEELLRYFNLTEETRTLDPRYNIAPSQSVPAVRLEEGRRELALLQWGLVPFWSREPSTGFHTINARSETAHSSPAFRASFRHRRCLIPASGFFEWQKRGKEKQPYYIFRKDGAPLTFAGLWDRWESQDRSQSIESCTILTTAASGLVARLHDRMPVILEPGDFDLWLDPAEHRPEKLAPLLGSAESSVLSMHPVSRYVNKAGNEGPECIEPLEEPA